jgi:hypothetical protein
LSFVNQVFVPRVDAITEVSRCGHSSSDERRMKMARRALATPQQAREASHKHSQSLEEVLDRTPLLQTEFWRLRHFWLELRSPRY